MEMDGSCCVGVQSTETIGRGFPATDKTACWGRRLPPPGFEQRSIMDKTASWGRRLPPPGFERRSFMSAKPLRIKDEAFETEDMIGQGSYGTVYRARDRATGEVVALKAVRLNYLSLREIEALSSCRHPSVIDLKEVVLDDGGSSGEVHLVMELADANLTSFLEDHRISEVRLLMQQLLEGVAHLHSHGVLHRDLKPDNLLLTNACTQIKISDFGLCRRAIATGTRRYSNPVVTLWYRAPELLIEGEQSSTAYYSSAIDVWSVGCIMAEVICRRPLFRGRTEMDQMTEISRVLGSPDDWGNWKPVGLDRLRRERLPPDCLSDLGFHLITQLLHYDPEKRITAQDALQHPWFHEEDAP